MLSVLAIVISLVLLIYLGYKGWSIVLLAPILALLAAVLTAIVTGGEFHILATYTEVFMTNMAGYVKSYFPFFLLGAIFGTVMDQSGSAMAIADFIFDKLGKGKEALAVVLACAVITYGGVSLFVAAFAIYPIGAVLFRKAGIPKRFLPGCIALGAFTFTMTAIPGTPQIQNTIPMKYFGTDVFAAPILGIIAALIMFIGGMAWLTTRIKHAMAKGEGYGDHPNETLAQIDHSNLPSFGTAIIPVIAVIVVNFVLSKVVFVAANADKYAYLEGKPYNTALASVAGTWALVIALIVGTLKEGVSGSFLAVMNTASEVGYGNVVKTLAGYEILAHAMLALSAGNPLVGGAISTSVLAGVTGSASGGMSIALATFADTFSKQAEAMGISHEVLHRVVAVASGGMDTLPHNGAVITLLAVTGMTHKESYVDIGMNTVIIPLLSCVVIIILGSIGIC